MGLIGLAKGITKMVTGTIEGDAEKVIKGAGQTAISSVTTVVSVFKGNGEEVVKNETDDVLDD